MLNTCAAGDDLRASAANDYAMRRVNLQFSSLFRVVFDMRVIPASLLQVSAIQLLRSFTLAIDYSVLYLDDLES